MDLIRLGTTELSSMTPLIDRAKDIDPPLHSPRSANPQGSQPIGYNIHLLNLDPAIPRSAPKIWDS